jgi:hypothetical protein
MVSAVYDFRCNSDIFSEYDDLHKFLDTKAKKWVFQLEKGEQTGYEHYQGRISLITGGLGNIGSSIAEALAQINSDLINQLNSL